MLGLPLGALGLASLFLTGSETSCLFSGRSNPPIAGPWSVRTASQANTIVGRTAEPAAEP
jgi:hypothetical protein